MKTITNRAKGQNMSRKTNRNAPTWKNQLWHARKLAQDKGLAALNDPHAMTGRICGCGSCFCCAALAVYNELSEQAHRTEPTP